MEFSGQYLTYSEYRGLGGTLDLMPFNLLEFEARRQIDLRTQNRLVDSKDIPQAVKLCEYAMINSINGYASSMNTASSNNVTSEGIDGYSVSYMTPNQVSDIVKSKKEEISDLVRSYLLEVRYEGEHLLFVGVE